MTLELPRVAIIGSGFGGSVMACRLAESGRFRVEVFERGRRYGRHEFPRRPNEFASAFWDPGDGMFGLIEYHSFDRSHIDVVTASGLGGGSLIYSNVLYRMPAAFFSDWPGGVTRELLDPYYDRALAMLEAKPYPLHDVGSPYANTPKSHALAEAVSRIRASSGFQLPVRLERPPLAIQFADQPDDQPGDDRTNAQGIPQTTCVLCGECNIGCNTHAKNTLDLNYLARAQQHDVTMRLQREVCEIRPRPVGGYTIVHRDPQFSQHCTDDYDIVVIAAGSLGSTRLLLQSPKLKLSNALGSLWSPNGDLLAFVANAARQLQPTRGPVITSAAVVDTGPLQDGFPAGLWIEDAGYSNLFAWYIRGLLEHNSVPVLKRAFRYLLGWFSGNGERNLGSALSEVVFSRADWTDTSMPILGMGRDRSTGKLKLRPGKRGRPDHLHLDWRIGPSRLHYQRMRSAMRCIANALNGTFIENPTSALNRYISVHPIGGCPMADSPSDGVVSARTGQVFNCPGLYVMDGSILPTSVGPNPSLTIAAIAELYAERLLQ
ncbi:MAG: GMC oxidoreductase [Phycisphaerales bacterium]|nr:GMC oxidoreductase [Phycisphaerales bacterium]